MVATHAEPPELRLYSDGWTEDGKTFQVIFEAIDGAWWSWSITPGKPPGQAFVPLHQISEGDREPGWPD
jgi:hypothetical protein